MPHDRKGNELKVGDLVMLPCRVRQVYPGATTCDVHLETLELMPHGSPDTFTTTARLCELAFDQSGAGRQTNGGARSSGAAPQQHPGGGPAGRLRLAAGGT